jgi:hypothetical protein
MMDENETDDEPQVDVPEFEADCQGIMYHRIHDNFERASEGWTPLNHFGQDLVAGLLMVRLKHG